MVLESLPTDVVDITLSFMEGLACPRSLTIAILVRHHEWEQIATMECDILHYNNPEDVYAARAASGFLKKCSGLPGLTDKLRFDKAVKQFYLNEASCYKSNLRLWPFVYNTYDDSDLRIMAFIKDVQKVVREILGDAPPSNWEGRFGPGATQSDKSVQSTVPDKMSSVPTMTHEAWPFMFPWTGTLWAKAVAASGAKVEFIRGNSFFTVIKDALTDRGCGKEPSINIFYQLGLGSEMKRLLRTWGLDLMLGQDVHRRVACSASLSGRLATIDLRQASDTMCRALVRLLLPPRWFEVLDALRSPTTNVDGKTVYLEKFSSMGNGFTFELETVLFAAIAFTACRGAAVPGKSLLVYGDDIIVPTVFAKDVMSSLSFLGFTVNETKSFVSGAFRESCGGDFYDGVAVRPFHLKELPSEPQHYIALANGIYRLGHSDQGGCRMHNLRRSWFRVLDQIPAHIRSCRGPKDLGDLVITDSEERWTIRWRDNCIRYVRVYRPAQYRRVRWDGFGYDVQLAAAVYGVRRKIFPGASKTSHVLGSRTVTYEQLVKAAYGETPATWVTGGSEGDLVPRDGVLGYKVGWVPFS